MAIFKAKVESQYTVIPNATAQDKNLSFEARGVLSMLLSLPEDWEIHKEWIAEQAPNCGRDKLTRILRELQDSGYMRKKVRQGELGRIEAVDWFVYPSSTVELKTRTTGYPSDGKPAATKETDIQKKHSLKDSLVTDESATSKSEKPKKSKFKFEEQDLKFAELMLAKILQVNPAFNENTNIKRWANDIRLIRERDKITLSDLWRIFEWANGDDFWQHNIQSPAKLRKQYPQLVGKMNYAIQQANSRANQYSTSGNRYQQDPILAPYERMRLAARAAGHDV